MNLWHLMGCVIGQLSINEWVAFDGLCNKAIENY